ncbi:hypothetical protein [Haloactinomyces albus]|uniref:DUF4878 domain-containing protein n=1 Tax=Haloactinomyces albus TaxID=1352928 RepID=A0AAE4CR77_9ACTN|nr:hypothetical protein [Haloactinomyces albus]MDR7303448.1 hypothetical protein [Haloactinomyces albus]
MTYPPQQPGQGNPYGQQPGWGQQPGGQYPPSGPQQPGYGGYGQQPGGQQYPPSGPQQQPTWGRQPGGQYPQTSPHPGWDGQSQPGWGQQPGFGGQPPKKSKKGLFIGIGVGGGVVVIGLIVTLALVFTGGPGSPRPVAQEFVNHFENKEFSKLPSVVCEKVQKQEDFKKISQGNLAETMAAEQGMPPALAEMALDSMKFDFRLGKVTDHGDSTATATMKGEMTFDLEYMGQSINQSQSMNTTFNMVVEDGQWKMCGSSGNGPL